MATSEALVKYYECLRNSFNKIQDKDNKAALINAALRPKIREEFAKSQEVLLSYLNYIQVFSLIYSDKFATICTSIIAPLLKEYEIKSIDTIDEKEDQAIDDKAFKVHETIRTIINSKCELKNDFIHTVVRVFPNVSGTDHEENKLFLIFLKNCLKICTYLDDETSVVLITKILERLNPPRKENQDQAEEDVKNLVIDKSYELIYECLPNLNEASLEKISKGILTAFTREFLTSATSDDTNYLLLYICSLDIKFADFFINSLWSVFTNATRPIDERRASVIYASSLISRATYINLDMVINYLRTASNWCEEFLSLNSVDGCKSKGSNETIASFYALTQSMFYLITQRYREMYEEETIAKLEKLNLNRIVESSLRPLDECDREVEQRFQEVASLYNLTQTITIDRSLPMKKRRVSRQDLNDKKWSVPFKESCKSVPDRIQPLYRSYYDHRNFTVYRE